MSTVLGEGPAAYYSLSKQDDFENQLYENLMSKHFLN